MPAAAWVTGGFNYKYGRPVRGTIRFVPYVPWIKEDGVYWACLAPTVALDDNGRFGVWLTTRDEWWWPYTVETPGGNYTMAVPNGRTSYTMLELLELTNEHHPRPGAAH